MFIAYPYCISLLHIFKAYLNCISLLSCCSLLLFGSWVDFSSFGECRCSIFILAWIDPGRRGVKYWYILYMCGFASGCAPAMCASYLCPMALRAPKNEIP